MASLETPLENTTLSPDQVKEVIEEIKEFIHDSKVLLCNTLPAIPRKYDLKVGNYTLSLGPGFISAYEEISKDCILQYTVTKVTPSPDSP